MSAENIPVVQDPRGFCVQRGYIPEHDGVRVLGCVAGRSAGCKAVLLVLHTVACQRAGSTNGQNNNYPPNYFTCPSFFWLSSSSASR